jgi:hypothetical protein
LIYIIKLMIIFDTLLENRIGFENILYFYSYKDTFIFLLKITPTKSTLVIDNQ